MAEDVAGKEPNINSLRAVARNELMFTLGFTGRRKLWGDGRFAELHHIINIGHNAPPGKHYAVKWAQYDPERDPDFLSFRAVCDKEKVVHRLVQHEHIVQLHWIMKVGPQLDPFVRDSYIWFFDYLPCDLQHCIDYGGQIIASELALGNLFEQIGSAIAYCHEKGVVHHDIKPANILVQNCSPKCATRPGHFASIGHTLVFKLSDFAVADHQHHQEGFTARVWGTPEYMSYSKFRALFCFELYDAFGADVFAFLLTLLSTIDQEVAIENCHNTEGMSVFEVFVARGLLDFLNKNGVFYSLLREMATIDDNWRPGMGTLIERFKVCGCNTFDSLVAHSPLSPGRRRGPSCIHSK